MSKIVVAANAMVENPEKISDVMQGYSETEIFFKYDEKYKWSIMKRNDGHFALIYYPGRQRLEELASIPDEHWHEFSEMVSYNTKEIGTKESLQSFKDLYSKINDMKYGMDDVLDSIIGTMPY